MPDEMIVVGADTAEADRQITALETRSKSASRQILHTLRQGYNTLIVFASAVGEAINISYQLLAQSFFVAAETITAISAAETASGWMAVKGALGFATAAMLFHKSFEVARTGEQASRELDTIINIANIWRLHIR